MYKSIFDNIILQQIQQNDAKMSEIIDAAIFFNSELIQYALKYFDKIRAVEALMFNIFDTITHSFQHLFNPKLAKPFAE